MNLHTHTHTHTHPHSHRTKQYRSNIFLHNPNVLLFPSVSQRIRAVSFRAVSADGEGVANADNDNVQREEEGEKGNRGRARERNGPPLSADRSLVARRCIPPSRSCGMATFQRKAIVVLAKGWGEGRGEKRRGSRLPVPMHGNLQAEATGHIVSLLFSSEGSVGTANGSDFGGERGGLQTPDNKEKN